MEDAEPVSSTTPSLDDPMEQWSLSKPQYEPIPDEATPEDEDDMIDLVGGGKEALDRHRINDNPTTDRFAMGEPHHPALVEAGEQLVTRGLWGDAPVTETKTEEPTEKPRVEPVSPVKETPAAAPPPTYEPHFSSASSQPLAHSSAVSDLLYWRDVKTTGVVFGATLFLLLSLTACSIISVFSYVALTLLSVTITFRIYKGILQAIQKSDDGHPFKVYLDHDVSLPKDVVYKYSDVALVHLNNTLVELRRLFLVEDLVDSLKFAGLMWVLTYVGALFNGLTLLILGLVVVFITPIVYEKHQAQIDHYVALARTQIKDIVGKIQAKVPGMKPKSE